MDFSVRITISRRRRSVALRAISKHEIEILTPIRLPEKEVEILLQRHEKAIEHMLDVFREKRIEIADGEMFFYRGEVYPVKNSIRMIGFDDAFILPSAGDRLAALEKVYRKLSERYIVERACILAEKFGIKIGHVRISGARHRLGSCSSSGNCSFSWRLIQFPDDLIDYVICHELAHRFQMNHSAAFYQELEKLFPGAANKKVELRQFSRKQMLI